MLPPGSKPLRSHAKAMNVSICWVGKAVACTLCNDGRLSCIEGDVVPRLKATEADRVVGAVQHGPSGTCPCTTASPFHR